MIIQYYSNNNFILLKDELIREVGIQTNEY